MSELKENKIETIDINHLNFLEFNRSVDPRQVNKLSKSILQFGIARLPVVCKTNIIDGDMKYYVIDGQHLQKSLLLLGQPMVNCIVFESSSKKDIVELMSTLNNVVSTWNIEDYVNAYNSLGNDNYNILKLFKISHNYTYRVAAHILGNSTQIRKGTFRVSNSDANILATQMNQICALLGNHTAKFMVGYINFYRQDSDMVYNHEAFMQKLAMNSSTLIIADNIADITSQLLHMHQTI